MIRKPLLLPANVRDAIEALARSALPSECCGLLAGRNNLVELHLPLVNHLASPVAYSAEPGSLFRAFKAIRAAEYELLAIYHSHPTSPPKPSRRDLDEWHYPDAMMVILSLMDAEISIAGWWLADGRVEAGMIISAV